MSGVRWATAILVLSVLVPTGWMLRPGDDVAGPCLVVSGPAMLPDIGETSGLAVSRRSPGVLWSHNDSGNAAELFAIDASGGLRGRVRVPIQTRDWEDVSAARCPLGDCLYIADIGDNRSVRARITIYRVPEPVPGDAQTAQPEVFHATYQDGPHNAEAMVVVGTEAVIITRDRTGDVYRSNAMAPGGGELTLRRVARLGLQSVTDAEASRDGQSVVVRTSRTVVFYRTADLLKGVSEPYRSIPIDGLREPQGEGVATDGDMLYLSSEGRGWNRAGRLVSLRCD